MSGCLDEDDRPAPEKPAKAKASRNVKDKAVVAAPARSKAKATSAAKPDAPSKAKTGKAASAQAESAQAKPAKASAKPAKAAASAPAPAAAPRAKAAKPPSHPQPFNILIVAQQGRLEYEAVLFAASLRASSPDFKGRLIVAEPQPQAGWAGHDTLITDPVRDLLTGQFGAEIVPFVQHTFSHAYPQGNKIEALTLLPAGENFVFFDTDTLVTGDLAAVRFDFNRPSASMRREDTWPEPPLYGPGYHEIWKSLYDRFGLDITPTIDTTQPADYWERYMYFNAGWFFGADAPEFARRFRDFAVSIRDDQPEELASQSLWPWLDQIALPLVIASFGGGRPGPELAGLDGDVTCHYRLFPLLYARESDRAVEVLEEIAAPNKIKKVLREFEPLRRLVFQGQGRKKIRPMFDRDNLPRKERVIRNALKDKGLWLR